MGIGKGIVYTGLGLLAVGVLIGGITPFLSIMTAPGRVITKTMDTNNIISNYEMFFDLNAGYTRRIADINTHKGAVAAATGDEKNRLNIELLGMQQTCRDLVVRYNAESRKLNKELFKSNNLPADLDINTCN